MIISKLRDTRIRAALALGAVLAVGVTGTYASWTDSVPVSGITITAGTLDLTVDGQDTEPTYTKLNMTDMVPGNSTAAVLKVKNAGTIPLTYYVDSTASGTLSPALAVKVTNDSTTSGSSPSVTCGGPPINGSGTSFGSSLLGSSSAPLSLAVGAIDSVCIQATLPSDADNNLQGQSTTVTLTFNASQVTS